jgi:hypothetical protein
MRASALASFAVLALMSHWLILLARHKLAHGLWERINSAAKEPKLDF